MEMDISEVIEEWKSLNRVTELDSSLQWFSYNEDNPESEVKTVKSQASAFFGSNFKWQPTENYYKSLNENDED